MLPQNNDVNIKMMLTSKTISISKTMLTSKTIPISKTMAEDIIKNGDEDKMPSKKPGKTEHHDFWRTYEDLIPAIELYKDTHEML